ncbi:MAG: LamG-like jellyroll fold domain-containing protein, partial [Verrucomicrobiota bacterium]
AQYSAWDLHEWLRAIHERTGRPIWLTEFNNGANWTCCEPSQADNAVRIGEFIDMMGWTPFVERYAIFNWVGDNRRMVWDGGSPLPAGQRYRDHNSPLANFQELPDPGTASAAYYLFEGNLHDSSGNGHNSTAGGVPTFGTGKFGQAASFDGSDAYMQLSPKLGDSTDFSFGAWVWWNGGGNWQRIFDLGDGTERFLCLSPKTGSGTLRFTIKNGGAEQQLNAAALVPNVWTHVAVTISGNTGKLFVNGALANTNTGMTINPAEIGTRFNYLGKSQFADPLLNGRLDEVRFLATALTDAQVAAMASGTPPRFNGDTLVKPRGVRFQPYTGSIAADASGSGALTFSKLSGPAWLAVAANGRLTGVPGLGDGGENRFLVRVSDVTGAIDTALLTLPIADQLGLTARYSFNGTVNSAVGGAHGVASGSPSYVGGRSGSAIDLDGTDDSVRLPHGIASEEEITVATWVHWDGGANWQRIFDFGNGTGESMFLTPRSGGNTLRFSINSNSPEQFIETTPLA